MGWIRREATLCGVRFRRGHGSTWGSQFLIELSPTQITKAVYFPPNGERKLKQLQDLPLPPEVWQKTQGLVQKLLPQLKKVRKRRLCRYPTVDGGEFRYLTLLWERGRRQWEVTYQWPQCVDAQELETLFEKILDKEI